MRTRQSKATLPDELIERIIAMLPFPQIVKAKGLSRSWRANFSAVSSLADEETRRRAEAFQKQVQERATNWSSYFPVRWDGDFLCGYDRTSTKWVKLPSLSFLPQEFYIYGAYTWIEGSLLYSMYRSYDRPKDILYVANIITRKWKKSEIQLPERAISVANPVSVWDASSKTYRVIYLQGDSTIGSSIVEMCSARIYDSKSDVWSAKRLFNEPLGRRPVSLNGILYMLSGRQDLLAFNMAEGTLERIKLSFDGIIQNIMFAYLVVCDGQLYMLVKEKYSAPVRILVIDLGSRELLEMARAPDSLSKGGQIGIDMEMEPVSDGNCIFFPSAKLSTTSLAPAEKCRPEKMVKYNVDTDEWSVFNFASKMPPACKSTKPPIYKFKSDKWCR